MKNLVAGLILSVSLTSLSYAEIKFTSNKGPNACLKDIAQTIVEEDPVLANQTVVAVKNSGGRQQVASLTGPNGNSFLVFRAFTGTWILGNSESCYSSTKSELYNSEILYKVENLDRTKIHHIVYGSLVQSELEKIQMSRLDKKIAGY